MDEIGLLLCTNSALHEECQEELFLKTRSVQPRTVKPVIPEETLMLGVNLGGLHPFDERLKISSKGRITLPKLLQQ